MSLPHAPDWPFGEPVTASANSCWPALTVALRDGANPVRRFIDARFSHMAGLQSRYRLRAGALAVEGSSSSGTLGTAFDWLLRFCLHRHPDLALAAVGVLSVPALRPAMVELARLIGYPVASHGRFVVSKGFEGPVPGSGLDPQLLARACWVLALLTEIYRIGLLPESPLRRLDLRRGQVVTAEQLMDLVPPEAVDELLQLRGHAVRVLLPALAGRPGQWVLGPSFAGTALMNADADVIAAGLLLELKTSLGRKRPDGSRQPQLDGQTIKQLVGYVLLDFIDEFALRDVGVYNARYAHLATWPLQEFLDELAGCPVDLAEEREAFRVLLLSGVVDR